MTSEHFYPVLLQLFRNTEISVCDKCTSGRHCFACAQQNCLLLISSINVNGKMIIELLNDHSAIWILFLCSSLMTCTHSVNFSIHYNCPSFIFSEMCSISRVELFLNTCVLIQKCIEIAKSSNCLKGRVEKLMEDFTLIIGSLWLGYNFWGCWTIEGKYLMLFIYTPPW